MSADGAALSIPVGKPWRPGQSGNPGGISKIRRAVLMLARDNSVRAMERVIELVEDEDPKVALAASICVLERAHGKAKTRDLTKEQIEAEVDKRLAELAAKANEMLRVGAIDVTPEK